MNLIRLLIEWNKRVLRKKQLVKPTLRFWRPSTPSDRKMFIKKTLLLKKSLATVIVMKRMEMTHLTKHINKRARLKSVEVKHKKSQLCLHSPRDTPVKLIGTIT